MALREDLGKSAETYLCETGMTLAELSYQIQHVSGWARDKRHPTKLVNFHAKSATVQEPYGGYPGDVPLELPLYAEHGAPGGGLSGGKLLHFKAIRLLACHVPGTAGADFQVFPPEYVAVVEGGRAKRPAVGQDFDYIFFTGSVAVGKTVMEERRTSHPGVAGTGGKVPVLWMLPRISV